LPPTFTDEGLRAALAARREVPGLPVLVLSQYVEERYATELLSDRPHGVGYLLKDRVSDLESFVADVRRVAGGGCVIDAELVARLVAKKRAADPLARLTRRERTVLSLMARGRSNQAISAELSLSGKTIEAHVSSIFAKLDLAAGVGDNRRVLAVLRFLQA
ncbi:MAG: DNA-binding response regulator, partial [Pseudonocardiales bacterium]